MKTLKFVIVTLLFAGLFFTSCKKTTETASPQEELTAEEATSVSDEIVETEATLEEIDYTADEQVENVLFGPPPPPGSCPTVTKDQPQGVFPVMVTIDFGASCEGPDGKIRSGKIVINLSAQPMTAGATKTVTLVDFMVDGKSVEGVRTWTNNGLDDQGRPSWSRSTTGAKITWPDGSTKTWEANHTILMTAGFTTPHYKMDDEFEITGSRSVVRKDGTTFSSTITTPLLKKHICRWIVSGEREITRNGNTATLDYGNGDCDKWGTLTLPDGTTKEIKLKPWRHH